MPPDRLEEQMGLRTGPKSLSCDPGLRQISLLLCKAAGEKSTAQQGSDQEAEGHTLKGNKDKLIVTDGEDLNIHHLGVGVRVAVFQLCRTELLCKAAS